MNLERASFRIHHLRVCRSADILGVALAAGLVLAVALFYVVREQPVYVWDFKLYWTQSRWYGELLTSDPLGTVWLALQQIRSADYNPLPVLLPSLATLVFGDGRGAYIAALVLLYLLPCCLLFARVVARAEPPSARRYAGWLALGLALLYAPFWRPTLRGLPDIVGLLPVLGAMWLVMAHDFAARPSLKRALWLGLLLWLPFVLRRWYAYTVVTLYLTLPLLALALSATGSLRQRLRAVLFNFLVAGATSLSLVLIFQWPLIARVLQADYSVLYAGYQLGRAEGLAKLLRELGGYLLPLFLAGLLRAAWRPGPIRALTVFSAANLLLSFWLFTATQSPSIHHNLAFALWVGLIAVWGASGLLQALPGRSSYAGAGLLVALLAWVMVVSQYGLAPGEGRFSKAFPQAYPPLRLAGYSQYRQLAQDLESQVAPDEKFAVLASSLVLSDDLLLSLSQERLRDRLLYAPQIDLQDGWKPELMQAAYLVVADPVQTHLVSGQEGIVFPARQILAGEGLGRAYQKQGPGYQLDDGVTAYVYRRVRPLADTEADAYIDYYYKLYPQWRDEYPRQSVFDQLTN